jgi:eukaryotic-like serine/threonine-protein kinase
MEELHIIRYQGEHDQAHCLAWSPDGRHLAFGDDARPHPTVQVWRAEGGKMDFLLAYLGHQGEVTALSWSPDGERIASASMDGMVHIWDVASGKRLCAYREHVGEDTWVLDVAWSPDGTRIASAEGGPGEERQYSIHVWEAATDTHLLTYQGHSASIYSLAWSPDSARIASGSYDSTVQVWEAGSGALLATHPHPGWVHAVAWSPDGSLIAAALDDYMVQVWDAETGEPGLTYQAHDGKPSFFPFAYTADVAWSPDSRCLLTGSSDGVVQIFAAATGDLLLNHALDEQTDRSHTDGVVMVAWPPSEELIALIVLDGTVRIWRLEAA